MGDIDTVLGSDKSKHLQECKKGNHEALNFIGRFSFQSHAYFHVQCCWCKNHLFVRDEKAISREEYEKAHEQYLEELRNTSP